MLDSDSTEELAFLNETEITCQKRNAALTPIRRAILTLLYRHPAGLGAYELLDLIRAVKPKASPPTVYRALGFLTEQGLARRIGCINVFVCCNRTLREDDLPGLFLVCPQCKNVSEITDTKILDSISRRVSAAGHTFVEQKFVINAMCPSCMEAERRTRPKRSISTYLSS